MIKQVEKKKQGILKALMNKIKGKQEENYVEKFDSPVKATKNGKKEGMPNHKAYREKRKKKRRVERASQRRNRKK